MQERRESEREREVAEEEIGVAGVERVQIHNTARRPRAKREKKENAAAYFVLAKRRAASLFLSLFPPSFVKTI